MAEFGKTDALRDARQHFQAGRVREAEALCRRALKADRKNAAAWHLLGRISYHRGAHAEAISHFDKCTRARPNDPGYLGDLARMLAGSGRPREAIAKYDRALKIDRRYRPALSGKASTLDRMGRTEEVRELLAPYIGAGDADAEMVLVFATLEQQAGRHREAVDIASQHVDEAEAPPTVRRHLGFMIGKSLDRLGEYEAAFEAFRRANEQPNDLGAGARPFSGP